MLLRIGSTKGGKDAARKGLTLDKVQYRKNKNWVKGM